MKLGVSTYAYAWSIGVAGHRPQRPMTAMDLLEQAGRLGVEVVQVADNLPLDQMAPAELDAFQAEAERRGIQVEVGTRGITTEHLRHCLALARRFHSPILRVVVDSATEHPTPAEVVARLAPLGGEFEAAGITLAIENHDRFQTRVLADVVRQLGTSWAGICLDTVNSFGALEGPQVVVDELGPLVVNLHIKDFVIFRAEHMMGFAIEGRPAGQGQLDIPMLLARLQQHGRPFNAILELWTPPEADLDETLAKEQDWVAASVAYLRGLIAA